VAMNEDLQLTPETPRNTFAAVLRERLQELDLSLERYEEMIEAQLLDEKLTNQYATGIPDELEQVNMNVILLETDAAAVAARQRIVDGEDFGEVAAEVSQHSSASAGGALGWTPEDLLQDDLAEAVFALEGDALSEVIEAETGFYIVKLDGKEVRPADPELRSNLARTYFGERLDEAAEQYQPQNLMTVGQAQEIVSSLGS